MAEQLEQKAAPEGGKEVKGYPWESLEDPKEGSEYSCFECKLLARDVVEMICPEHDGEEVTAEVQFCEGCLVRLLASNGNKCPISQHANPKYFAMRRPRMKISNFAAVCSKSVAMSKQNKG